MSTDEPLTTSGSSDSDSSTTDEELPTAEQLAGELAVLEAENERLRREYVRVQQSQYRRSALALSAVGVIAGLVGLLFPTARTVLWALAGTGLFLGVLTYYLSPEQFLSATVGRDIYGSLATNERAVVDELGVDDRQLYVPVEGAGVRLFVPESTATSLPPSTALSETFVVTDDHRGVAFQPTGQPLYDAFERGLEGDLAEEPAALVTQLREALVAQFELVASTEQSVPPEATTTAGTLTVGVSDSAYGPLDQFDHPVRSFLGVGLAQGLARPVEVELAEGSDRVDAVVTCRWPPEEVADPPRE